MSVVLVAVLLLQTPPERVAPEAEPRGGRGLEAIAQRVLATVGDGDAWGRLYAEFAPAVEEIFARNGWTSEPDRFALDVALEVGAIPPWDLQGRLDTVTDRLTERYALDETQQDKVRELFTREFRYFLSRHAARLAPNVIEALQTRLAGEPFTPEQVARWTRDAAPLYAEARARFESNVAEFVETLRPEQRGLVLADVAAAGRRLERMDELRQSWEQGGWEAADWGLDRDPIQSGSAAAGEDAAGGPPGNAARMGGDAAAGAGDAAAGVGDAVDAVGRAGRAATQPSSAPGETDPWAAYVREFIRRYALTEAQQQRAWIIYDAARRRRDVVEQRDRRRAERLATAELTPERVRELRAELERTHTAVLSTLLGEMKRRLERLPTRAQRAAAEQSAPAEAPTTAPVKPSLAGP